jgi:ribA/ribD-fused uncharacterized protein
LGVLAEEEEMIGLIQLPPKSETTQDILEFRRGFQWLKNFWPSPVMYEGQAYPTVEHAYQAAKTTNEKQRDQIRKARLPSIARAYGQKVMMRPNWADLKIPVMLDLLRQKFSRKPLRDYLSQTGNVKIEEGNWWGDRFWGVCPAGGGVGENHLGKLIMQVRGELRS